MVGLEFYEIVAISAMCAVGILTVAALIGVTVAHFVLREPHPVGEAAVRETPTRAAFEPAPRVAVG